MPSAVNGKTYGTVPADRQKQMSGLEFVQALADGTLPLNTIAETLGYDVTEAVSGRVVVSAVPTGAHLNPAGTVHGGLSATLLDKYPHGAGHPVDAREGRWSDDARIQDFACAPHRAGDGPNQGGRRGVEPWSPNWDCGRADNGQ